jgi:quercetin dioxygenase-like cupin family protein
MKIFSNGMVDTILAPAKWFTGTVIQTPILSSTEPDGIRSTLVTFAPKARTNWHSHPKGQTLYITSGTGLVQIWGGPIHVVRAGDVISFAPDEKHWHGAGQNTTMTHVTIQENDAAGSYADWLEPVSDEQYQNLPL